MKLSLIANRQGTKLQNTHTTSRTIKELSKKNIKVTDCYVEMDVLEQYRIHHLRNVCIFYTLLELDYDISFCNHSTARISIKYFGMSLPLSMKSEQARKKGSKKKTRQGRSEILCAALRDTIQTTLSGESDRVFCPTNNIEINHTTVRPSSERGVINSNNDLIDIFYAWELQKFTLELKKIDHELKKYQELMGWIAVQTPPATLLIGDVMVMSLLASAYKGSRDNHDDDMAINPLDFTPEFFLDKTRGLTLKTRKPSRESLTYLPEDAKLLASLARRKKEKSIRIVADITIVSQKQ